MTDTQEVPVEVQVAEARLAALRQDPRVIVHERTIFTPYVPKIKGTPQTDVLELLGRRESSSDDEQPI
ncbi:MAG TPA: hypothetical protein VII06_10720 [Chloroflexota bacterium]|jgi:hypothetical protein